MNKVRISVKRIITMILAVIMLIGNITNYGSVVIAALYESDEIVIETDSLISMGKIIFNGQVRNIKKLTDVHDGIIRMLDSETDIIDSLIYGNNTYYNEHSIFSNGCVQINADSVELSNVIVAEKDITINASMMHSDEYTIIYSKSGNVRFNLGTMNFKGIIYAPEGSVTFSASDVCIDGRIIASAVSIYAGVFQINGLEKYTNVVDKLEFLSNDTILDISRMYDQEEDKYSIIVNSDNRELFRKLDVYVRYNDSKSFDYLCELADFEDVGLADIYDKVDIVLKGTTKFNESVYSNVRSFHMDEGEVRYARLDTDEDGIEDGEEVLFTKTNPNNADSDSDGILDYAECFYLYTNPNAKTADGDFDEDGLSNFDELEAGTNPYLYDCDMDGITDGEDVEPLIYTESGRTPDCDRVCIALGKYDKILNGWSEDGEVYQYVYNYITEDIKAVSYSDQQIMYFYDADSNIIADIRQYKDAYRVNSSKYNEVGNVTDYSNNGNVYTFTYDEYDKVICATLNGRMIINLSDDKIAYGNGDIVSSVREEDIYSQYINDEETVQIICDAEECVEKYIYGNTGIEYEYLYGEEHLDSVQTSTGYKIKYQWGDDEYKVNYSYGESQKEQTICTDGENAITTMISGDVYKQEAVEDSIIYTISDGEDAFYKAEYVFDDNTISKIVYHGMDTMEYIYNASGQMISVTKNDSLVNRYEYNTVGHLVAVYDYNNKTVEKYVYDMYNNIKTVETYTYDGEIGRQTGKAIYEYQSKENKDRLTSYNGFDISYDEVGNPLKYYDGTEFEWSGRQLDSIRGDEAYVQYAYDITGLRTQKKVGDTTTDFYYDSEDIILEVSDNYTIWYIYDDTTDVLGFSYNGQNYYYVKNAQKDVIGIVDSQGSYVCGYTYDAWGKLMSIEGNMEIAQRNPIRYRSYYYDAESELYYLKTRYYDPEIRRFISMDDICDVAYGMVDPNIYAYCCNDPVNMYDPEGRAAIEAAIFTSKEFLKGMICLLDDMIDVWGAGNLSNSLLVSDDKDEFIKWWNEEIDKEQIVFIYAHGQPNAIFSNIEDETFYINAGTVDVYLKKKDIKLLVILGCNSGHFTEYKDNIAYAFSKKISGKVIASDGTVYAGYIYKYPHESSIQFESCADKKFIDWNRAQSDKRTNNFGWLIYDKNKIKPGRTGYKLMTTETIYKIFYNKIYIVYK